jgi:peptidoglycan/xylan/chitin deacetylase (PgdA/CDA1 family)
VARKLGRAASPGAILLLHDGRELQTRPGIASTVEALRLLLPRWRAEGYELTTLSALLEGE